MRWRAMVLVAALLVSCGGGAEDTTTTATTVPRSPREEDFVAALASSGAQIEPEAAIVLGHDLCRSLLVLQAAGVQGAIAADALRRVDLDRGEDIAVYGQVLSAAAQTLCPEAAFYAADVSYWLGA